MKRSIFCRLCRYFRIRIKRILDRLIKVEFTASLEKSSGSEESTRVEKRKKGKHESEKKMEKPQRRHPVDVSMQEKKDIAKEYMVIINRNWGKMSPMMLAAETRDPSVIGHDLCWKVIGKVWRNGAVRHQVSTTVLIVRLLIMKWRNLLQNTLLVHA